MNNDMTMLSNVALVTRPWLRYFFVDVARTLKRRHGSTVHFYVRQRGEVAFYERFVAEGAIDTVSVIAEVHAEPDRVEPDPVEVLVKAREYERRLGRTINSLAASDKMLGAAFAIGGYRFPRSKFYKKVTEIRFARALVDALDFWSGEFEQKNISCLLNGWTVEAAAARLKSIPYRHLIAVGYENYCHWVTNEFHENPLIQFKYEALSQPSQTSAEIFQPYLSSRLGNQARLANSPKFSTFARSACNALYRHAKALVRGHMLVYPLWDELKQCWLLYSQFNKVLRTHKNRLAELEGTEFIYFPLAREPEVPYMMMTPEYFYQLAAVTSLVRDLPTGWQLAVKEHISAIGPRPREFYDQIRYFKPVRLMDIRERGVDCVRQATAVATIAGSAGIEAAVAGKPVISFGRHNSYCFLPHVMVVTDEAQIHGYIRAILDGEVDLDKAHVDGARFLEAVIAASFDMRDFDWEHMKDYEVASLEECVDRLEESLRLLPVASRPTPTRTAADGGGHSDRAQTR